MEVTKKAENKGKKVLIAITKGTPWGGAQRYVYDMACGAKAAGFEVVAALGNPGTLGAELKEAGVRVIELPHFTRDIAPVRDRAAFTELLAVIKHERPDILHLNSSKMGGLGALAGRIARVPRIIFTAHGWAFNEKRPLLERLVIGLLHFATVALSHVTLCNSEATRHDARFMPLVQKKLRVVHLGLEAPEFTERMIAREYLLPQKVNAFWIGAVGELHESKGFLDALEAFAKVAAKHEDAIFLIMGEGELRPVLEKRIRELGLETRVYLPGYVTRAAGYLKAFDVFLLPSKTESLGLALIEAGFAALPAVGAEVGGIPEIIENGVSGLLVPAGNAAKMADAIEALMKDPVLRRSLGERLQEKASGEFSKERMVARTLGFYRS